MEIGVAQELLLTPISSGLLISIAQQPGLLGSLKHLGSGALDIYCLLERKKSRKNVQQKDNKVS